MKKRGRPKREIAPGSPRDPILKVQHLWREAKPATGTPAEAYFRSIGFTGVVPPTIRFRPPGIVRLSTVVVAVQSPDRKVCAVLLILLDRQAPRLADLPRPRVLLGAIGAGAVRLAAAGPGLEFKDTVEEALLRLQSTGLPTWARLAAWRREPVEMPRADWRQVAA